MSAAELGRLLGRDATWSVGNGLQVRVLIVDARDPGWGRTDVKIRPVEGSGEVWVDLAKVSLDEEA